jgi:hypothetical protein
MEVYLVPSHEEPIHQLDPPLPPLTVLHYQDPSTPYGPEACSSTRFSSFFVLWLFSFLRDSVAAYIEVDFLRIFVLYILYEIYCRIVNKI